MPGLDPSMVANAVEAAAGLVKMGVGFAQGAKANKLAKKIVEPKYDIQQPVYDNQALAERNASQGLSDAAMTAYENNANRGLTTGIDALIRGAGSINSFADFYDRYADDSEKIFMLEDELRSRNQGTYMNQNGVMADALDKQWQINMWKPVQDQKQYIASLRGQSMGNISGGISGLGSAASHYAAGQLYKNDGRLKVDNTGDPSVIRDNFSGFAPEGGYNYAPGLNTDPEALRGARRWTSPFSEAAYGSGISNEEIDRMFSH